MRLENELLRSENLRLRAAVCAARPETPQPSATVPSTPVGGGALGAADRLVHLMQEGGNLLQEREALRAENEALESELEAMVAGSEAAGSEEGGPDAEAPNSADEGEEQTPDGAMVERLMPLLSEGDALRTERVGLRHERQELLSELEAMGATAAGVEEAAPDLETAAVDQELEQRFLSAVEDASRENAALEAEIQKLREENSRLRTRNTTSKAEAIKPEKEADIIKPVPEAPEPIKPANVAVNTVASRRPKNRLTGMNRIKVPEEEDIDLVLQQREAMASLLRKSQVTSPSTARSSPLARTPAATKKGGFDRDQGQEQALKGALHTLFRNFGR